MSKCRYGDNYPLHEGLHDLAVVATTERSWHTLFVSLARSYTASILSAIFDRHAPATFRVLNTPTTAVPHSFCCWSLLRHFSLPYAPLRSAPFPLPIRTMKRSSERQITKDDRSDDEADGAGADGAFQRAPPEVLARRRIIKVRRRGAAGGGGDGEEDNGGDGAAAAPRSSPARAFPTSLGAAVMSGNAGNAFGEAQLALNAAADGTSTSIPLTPAVAATNAAASPKDAPAAAGTTATDSPAAAVANDAPSAATANDAPARAAAITTTEAALPPSSTSAPAASASDAAVATATAADAHADGVAELPKADALKTSATVDVAVEGGNAAIPDASATVGEANNKTVGSGDNVDGASSEPAAAVAAAPKPAFTFGGFSGDVAGGFTFGASSAGGQPFSFGGGGTPFTVPPALATGTPFGALPVGRSSGTGAPHAAAASGASLRPDMKQVEAHTGEEEESVVFHARAKLYLLEGGANWKERGVGVVKVNVHSGTGAGRLLMRTEATLHVILNTPLFSGFVVDRAADRAVRFTGLSLEDEKKNVSYLLRFSVKDDAAGLVDAISSHVKGSKGIAAKAAEDEGSEGKKVDAEAGQVNKADTTAGDAKTADARTGDANKADTDEEAETSDAKTVEAKAAD